MPFQELFDETLDINSTENYELSVQVSAVGLSFCILDTLRNKFILFRNFEPEENKNLIHSKIRELIEKDDFLTRKYKKVNVVLPSSRFTLVPTPLFDPGKKDDYFNFNQINEDGITILTNKINDPDTYLLFSESENLITLINDFYPGIHPYHHLKPLFNNISHSRKSIHGNYIHLHVERDYFDLIVFNNNILKFCNVYFYRNVSDILYYVLNVFRKLDIKQEETIHLSGQTEKYDDLSSGFSMYVRNMKFAEPSGNFTFSYVFNDTDLHRFLNLFNSVNCE